MNEPSCKACDRIVALAPGEVERILREFFQGSSAPRASNSVRAARLQICNDCADLQYGTTCRHCGCLVEVRAALKDKQCPAPVPRW